MRIVCLGEALVDLSPPRGTDLSTTSRLGVRIGGAPLNVAIHLKKHGANPFFLGALSNDSFGDRIRELLRKRRIEFSPSRPVNAPTRIALVERRDGHPPFSFYGHRPADTRLTLTQARRAITDDTRALYVGSLMMTNPRTARVQMEIIRMAAERGDIVVVSDPNPRAAAWPNQDDLILATERLLAHSWLTKLSLDDARELGWPDQPDLLVAHLKQRTSGYAIVTDGPRGCWLEGPKGLEHVAAPEVDEVDPTGAGDAFFATIVANALRDWGISTETLVEASRAGAAIAARRGAF